MQFQIVLMKYQALSLQVEFDSFTSANTTSTSIGPVFLTVACISFSINSIFSIDTSGSTTPNCKNVDAGLREMQSLLLTIQLVQ